MGKKKTKGEYNDFTEDTRYQNKNDIQSTLQTTTSLTRTVSPPLSDQASNSRNAHSTSRPKKPQLTHFLCLPLLTPQNRPQLATALSNLRGDVERLTPVPPKAIRPVGTLHLTLGVMSLSAQQLSDAIQHLEDLDIAQLLRGITTKTVAEQTLDSPSVSENAGAVANPSSAAAAASSSSIALSADPEVLNVRLQGLLPMQRPRQTSILYAEPREGTGRLGRFAESVRMAFEEKGYVVKDERGLRLHATVLNTVYAKPKGGGRGARGKGRSGKAGMENVEGRRDGEVDGDVAGEQGTDGENGTVGGKESNTAHGRDAKSWMRFDASALIEAYKDFVWADDVRIDRVQICKMGAKKTLHQDTGEVLDEEYEVVAEKRM